MTKPIRLASAAAVGVLAVCSAQAAEPLGKGLTMYMQMGGNAGDGATWARTNGALAAGDAFGLADCAALPPLFYGNMVEPFGDTNKNVTAYFERLKARPSVARVLDGDRVVWVLAHGALEGRHLGEHVPQTALGKRC